MNLHAPLQLSLDASLTREPLEAVAKDIAAEGGSAEVAELDALDERAVDEHARAVVSQAGSIDISFNLVSRGDVQVIPLVEMTTADFTRPITTGITASFITARAAARHMIEQGSGVILALDSGHPGRPSSTALLMGAGAAAAKVFRWEATTPSAHQCRTVPEGSLK